MPFCVSFCALQIKLFWSRLNIPTLLVACQQNLHWNEAVFLYTHYDQFDNAIDVMIQHSAECWKHSLFKEIILQVSNTEIYYRALQFYLTEHPLLLNDLLLDLSGKLDHSRVVDIVSRVDHIPLIEKYLVSNYTALPSFHRSRTLPHAFSRLSCFVCSLCSAARATRQHRWRQ